MGAIAQARHYETEQYPVHHEYSHYYPQAPYVHEYPAYPVFDSGYTPHYEAPHHHYGRQDVYYSNNLETDENFNLGAFIKDPKGMYGGKYDPEATAESEQARRQAES